MICELVKSIKFGKSRWSVKTVFKDSSINDVLLTFMYDNDCNRLLLFYKSEEMLGKIGYKLKIYNEQKNMLEFEVEITSEDLIGRFLSGRFSFTHGFMYFQNSVVKVRYDLIESSMIDHYTEKEIFDTYDNVLKLDSSLQVNADSPLNSY